MKMLNIKYTALFATFALLGAACDKEEEPKVPVHNFVVEEVEITPKERSAEVNMAMPYYTIDGVKVEGTTPSVEYRLDPTKENTMKYDWSTVTEYSETSTGICFSLTNLIPSSHYELRVSLDAGEYGTQLSEVYNFKTADAPYIFNPKANLSTQGFYAYGSLSNVILYIDKTEVNIETIRIDYNIVGSNEVHSTSYNGSNVRNGALSITIPAGISSHLEPESDYEARIIAIAEDAEYEAFESISFTTTTADIEVLFGAMKARIGGGKLIATLAESLVTIDEYYTSTEHKKEILYRVKGDEEWNAIEVDTNDEYGKIEAQIDIDELSANTTYEVSARISLYGNEYMSSRAEVTTPESDEIVVPEPPVGGDTSMMEGTWHLTQWRDTEPSFDIYMVITATGGITLWQRLEDCEWELYQSAAETADGIISGTYTDGVEWGASYYYTVSGDEMTWTDTEDSDDVSVYERSTLPDELEEIAQAEATRSLGARFL